MRNPDGIGQDDARAEGFEAMTGWLERTLKISSSVLSALLLLTYLFVGAVVVRFVAEYFINTNRSTDHWAEYFDVIPTRDSFPIGKHPKFISHSIWHLEVRAAWPDVLRCKMLDGPEEGEIVSFRLQLDGEEKPWELSYEPLKPRMSGFYDNDGKLVDGSTSGIWTWSGQIPKYRSVCWLEPKPVVNPSPFVYRDIPAPDTKTFLFE